MLCPMRVIVVGDVYGSVGRRALARLLPGLMHEPCFVVVNGENAAGGRGLHRKAAREIFAAGADVITLGNHAFDHREVYGLLEGAEGPVVRPLNLPPGAPGQGYCTVEKHGERFTVVNLLGRVFMGPAENPFVAVDTLLERDDLGAVLLDFHAEATSEKQAMGYHLAGRATAVLGTHTHVQTADARVLNGTGYLTDLGMTGASTSVIGAEVGPALSRFVTGLPARQAQAGGPGALCAAVLEVQGGRCTGIEAVTLREPDGPG